MSQVRKLTVGVIGLAGLGGALAFGLLAGCGSSPAPTDSGSDIAATAPAAVALPPPEYGACAACHTTVAGVNAVGPSLAGIVGRKAGTVPAYAYSDALKASGIIWTEASLDKWLTAPAAMVPGTKMGFVGYPDAAKRQAVIGFLKTLK